MNLLMFLMGVLFVIIAVVLIVYRTANKDKSGPKWLFLVLIAMISLGTGINFFCHSSYQDGLGNPVRILPVGEEYRVLSTQIINDEQYILLVDEKGKVVYYSPDTYIDVSSQDWLITVQTEKGLQLRTYT